MYDKWGRVREISWMGSLSLGVLKGSASPR